MSARATVAEERCAVCGELTRTEVLQPASTYARHGQYRIATCARCGCGQTEPRPSTEELSAFYAREYQYDAHRLIATEKRRRARRILDHALGNARRVLDVGCMYGYLVEEAVARGAYAAGVELSAGPAREARARGLEVFHGTLEAYARTNPAPFDLVVAQHVLEHVTDPALFLETARTLLAPQGRLCICVPNFDARARRVFPRAWGWYQVPVHLHHFTEHSLRTLLQSHGFCVEDVRRRGGDSLFVLITLAQGAGMAPRSDAMGPPGLLTRAAVQAASTLLRPYYRLGDDELMVLARRI
ncbi:MAG: class I SAM-dependent methyltransferase [Myxococcota bacterium]